MEEMKGKVVADQELSDISIESTSLISNFRGIRTFPLTFRWDDQAMYFQSRREVQSCDANPVLIEQ